VIEGQVFILKVRIWDSFGEDAFDVAIEPAPEPDLLRPRVPSRQSKVNIWRSSITTRSSPASSGESDLTDVFPGISASVHEMIKTLEPKRPHSANPAAGAARFKFLRAAGISAAAAVKRKQDVLLSAVCLRNSPTGLTGSSVAKLTSKWQG